MARILALTLLLVVVAAAEALAQNSRTRTRTPVMVNRAAPSMTVEERLESLESELQGLRSQVDQLTADLQQARQRADEAKSEAASLSQRLDPLTTAITANGPIVKVNVLEAVTVITESVVSESYTPGAGNIW